MHTHTTGAQGPAGGQDEQGAASAERQQEIRRYPPPQQQPQVAYVSIRRHTSAYVRMRQRPSSATAASGSIHQHTSAYVRMGQRQQEIRRLPPPQ